MFCARVSCIPSCKHQFILCAMQLQGIKMMPRQYSGPSSCLHQSECLRHLFNKLVSVLTCCQTHFLQGTMIGLAALASQPQLAASISLAVLIAPVAFTTAMTSPAFVLSSRLGFDRFALSQGWGEWGSFQQANSDAMMPICRWAMTAAHPMQVLSGGYWCPTACTCSCVRLRNCDVCWFHVVLCGLISVGGGVLAG